MKPLICFVEVLFSLRNCAGNTRFSRHTVVARERDTDSDPPSQAVAKRIAVLGQGTVEASDRKVAGVVVGWKKVTFRAQNQVNSLILSIEVLVFVVQLR